MVEFGGEVWVPYNILKSKQGYAYELQKQPKEYVLNSGEG